MRIQLTSPVEAETAVVEVLDGPSSSVAGGYPEVDRAQMDAQGRIAAIEGLGVREVSVGAAVRHYQYWART